MELAYHFSEDHLYCLKLKLGMALRMVSYGLYGGNSLDKDLVERSDLLLLSGYILFLLQREYTLRSVTHD